MEKTLTNRGKIRLASYLTAVVLVLSVFAISGNVRATRRERQIEMVSERALSDLDVYISNMESNLQKGIYANTPPMLFSMATNLWREATGAKTSLSVLPITNGELQNTYKFLSQIGDFVMTLQKKKETGGEITEEERATLLELLNYSKTLGNEITNLRERLFTGELVLENKNNTLTVGNDALGTLSASLEDTEQSFTEYPSLIYDGPFSDHMSRKESVFLEGEPEISKEEAAQKAAEILNLAPEKLQFTSEENDACTAYRFLADNVSIAITKKGGKLLYFLSSKYAQEEKLSLDEAKKRAEEFLKAQGFENMEENYYATNDGICTFNFAYCQDDFICYPDLVKVSVSLSDGEILSVDCRGYLLHHQVRDLKKPKLSPAQARKNLSPLLHVLEVRQAVIPTKGGEEKETYEFHCKTKDEEELLVYINTETGFEEDILLLLYSDGGVLTK